ncbi:MAG: glycosyl transferase [Alphaproteobacteria bacterium]|nr:MAG: glycosyl transferase [Alphaproteobacteria bacterium]
MKTALIIPTWNAQPWLLPLLDALKKLDPQPDNILFIDSSSIDDTRDIIKEQGFNVHQIPKKEFGHGKTRNLGASLNKDADILIYLTQDAIPAQIDLLAPILKIFKENADTAIVFGRQLPHNDANVSARYARLQNYPEAGYTNTISDMPVRGIKTFFCSNSFAAYRADTLLNIGGFPEALPLAEDMAVCARLLEAGYKSTYCADAQVRHSHNYGVYQDLTRYFDIGAFLSVDPWFKSKSIKSGGEGLRFVIGEFKYTIKHGTILNCIQIIPHTLAKFIGFKLGEKCKSLPIWLVRKISMHSYYWENT